MYFRVHRNAIYRVAAVSAAALLLALLAQPASARYLGDPAADLKKGQMAGGLSYSSMVASIEDSSTVPGYNFCQPPFITTNCSAPAQTVTSKNTEATNIISPFFKYGISDTLNITGDFGSVSSSGGGGSSTEFGATGKMTFKSMQLGGKPAKIGGLAAFHTGSGSDASYTEINVGAGVSVAATNQLNVYGAGTFTSLSYSIKGGGDVEVKLTSPIGVYGGAAFAVDQKISVGGEFHLLSEQGFALFGQFRF